MTSHEPASRPKASPPASGSEEFRVEIIKLVPQLRAFSRGLTGSRDRADDLVQDTLMRAIAGEHLFRPGTNLRAWLFTILRNRHLSEYRRRRYDGGGIEDLPEALVAVSGNQQAALELKEVQALLMTVPVKLREALILVSAAGLSYEEAAAVCKCAIGTIKSRVNRARAEITALMNKTAQPAGRRGPGGGGERDSAIGSRAAPAAKTGHGERGHKNEADGGWREGSRRVSGD
ncbi:MAG: sigma-70 family RNA polymerase sigma factor [Alphaproteobacteria bacterium]